ncbi:MAG: amidase [Betaproteobacteria bacterium]|nr:amidase [Betaproteobacteria bacterium]MDH5342850.1 amidase [Betaproteobacteria bacterium]
MHNRLSACEASRKIAAGELTAEKLTASCLERVAERETDVQAWAFIDPDTAIKQARLLDQQPRRSRLHGIPFGIKDVIDTHDMPTQYGSKIYEGNQPGCDAACVAQIREFGGLIMGKTVSTEFATRQPNKTRNPLNPAHTPGGSSSGSAAAVADFMVPIALGTQTSSSIVRPAAYCGVVGYKPSFGLINRAGLKFLSESLDTIGSLTRTIPDAALIVEELSGLTPTSFEGVDKLRPRIGLCRTPWWNAADDASKANLEQAARTLAGAGARVADVTLDDSFAALDGIQIELSSYEFNRALTFERTHHADLISPHLLGRIAAGGKVTRQRYEECVTATRQARQRIADIFRDFDILISPSAPGEAPGIDSTGEPIFGLLWTLLRLPCLTLPCGHGPSGLPLGIQFIAASGQDKALFLNAEWSMRNLQRD